MASSDWSGWKTALRFLIRIITTDAKIPNQLMMGDMLAAQLLSVVQLASEGKQPAADDDCR
jgi:hypothetical protein